MKTPLWLTIPPYRRSDRSLRHIYIGSGDPVFRDGFVEEQRLGRAEGSDIGGAGHHIELILYRHRLGNSLHPSVGIEGEVVESIEVDKQTFLHYPLEGIRVVDHSIDDVLTGSEGVVKIYLKVGSEFYVVL